MAINFTNIKTGEVQVAESEPMVAALWASSDRSPNANQGQDFGWRLAPEVVVWMRRIQNDPYELDRIARSCKKANEEITESDILQWISSQTSADNAPMVKEGDYETAYFAQIRELEDKSNKALQQPIIDEEEDEDALIEAMIAEDARKEALELRAKAAREAAAKKREEERLAKEAAKKPAGQTPTEPVQ